MSTVSTQFRPTADAPCGRSDLGVPAWALDLLARDGARDGASASTDVRIRESSHYTLVTVRKTGSASLDPKAFEACTRDAYTAIADHLRDRAARHPVRFWNYIPDIHLPSGGGLDRYMCFNAGRFAACSEWLGGPDAFDRLLATGSGVGHAGTDLVIHALASTTPGVAVENPRQIPAYKYSRRFGPRPPCFARATVLRETGRAPLVLVGGTASIRGEETMHPGDVRAQMLETFENLSVIVRTASGQSEPDRLFGSLRALRDLRVYYVRPADLSVIRRMVSAAMPQVEHVEYVRADLCRPELLVEIEGTAR